MTRYVPTLTQSESKSRVTTEQPVPMYRPPSNSCQNGAGKVSTSTLEPFWTFSNIGPVSTATGLYFEASDCQILGLPRNCSTRPRCAGWMGSRKIEESREGLLVLQV